MTLYLEDGSKASYVDVANWWLEHYEGMEHMTEGGITTPETWYTVTTILKRSLNKIIKGEK